MNNELQKFAREYLIKGLEQCSEAQQLLFKRMYAHRNLNLSIPEVVAQISEEKMDWAMEQVRSTLEKGASR